MAKPAAVRSVDRFFLVGIFLSLVMGSTVSLYVLLSMAF